jgi:hypothetical protein
MRRELARSLEEVERRVQDAASDPSKQRRLAAQGFWAYRMRNIEVYPAQCAVYGVDLGSYRDAFDDEHREVIRKADAIDRAHAIDRAASLALVRDTMNAQVAREIADAADAQSTTSAQICRAITDDPVASSAADAALERQSPELYRVIIATSY